MHPSFERRWELVALGATAYFLVRLLVSICTGDLDPGDHTVANAVVRLALLGGDLLIARASGSGRRRRLTAVAGSLLVGFFLGAGLDGLDAATAVIPAVWVAAVVTSSRHRV